MAAKRKSIALKEKQIEEMINFLKSGKIIGILNIETLPSPQLQEIKKKMRGKAEIKISKSLIIRKSIEKLGDENLKKLADGITGPSGIIVSDEDPFILYKFIKQNRSKTLVKAGQIAPFDIIVPAGETDMPAGPALAELKMAKIDVRIDKGKIAVQKDSIVAKKGEVISQAVSSALAKLGIKPMQIGLNVSGIYENGMIYKADVLDIDEEKFMEKLLTAIRNSINLSVNAEFPTKETISIMLEKAVRNARAVASEAKIDTDKKS